MHGCLTLWICRSYYLWLLYENTRCSYTLCILRISYIGELSRHVQIWKLSSSYLPGSIKSHQTFFSSLLHSLGLWYGTSLSRHHTIDNSTLSFALMNTLWFTFGPCFEELLCCLTLSSYGFLFLSSFMMLLNGCQVKVLIYLALILPTTSLTITKVCCSLFTVHCLLLSKWQHSILQYWSTTVL